MRLRLLGLAAGLAVTFATAPSARAADGTVPPEGFVSLFNGKDLAGWHGMSHFDPRKPAATADIERTRQIALWTEAANQHRTVEGGELEDRTSGYFGFAGHNDPVAFRNVSIKPLD
jgi:hypothetical protein